MKKETFNNLPQQCRGTSMVEVLVAMVILVVGLLGAAGMQVNSMRSHQDAYERTIALHQVSDMADRMRANMPGVNAGLYQGNNTVNIPACMTAPGGCNVQQVADYDVAIWNQDNALLLSGAVGVIGPPDASGLFLITLTWNGRNGNEAVAMSVRP